MDRLNYHHLRYFREVAHTGNLTQTAERVNLSQSALSIQIRQLEERLEHKLFERKGRSLVLTEVGRITLDYADRIFGTGEELIATLDRSGVERPPLRVGALSTLSRNFQVRFLEPALKQQDYDIVLKSGSENNLLDALRSLAIDVFLTTEPPKGTGASEFTAHKVAEQKVGLHGAPTRMKHRTLNELLKSEPIILPSDDVIRRGFDSLIARLDVQPRIFAMVDDMAMVRLLTRVDAGVAIAPDVVLADEITSGRIATSRFELDIVESFFAITVRRSFPHPLLRSLLSA